ncbi:helix-turn-helix transcriptional regulator [Ruania alba]|uniref:Predicted DNA-binding transcriptional regulator YafY, contains an HTH and WYL domains n=1 Tax=Ruania alba TaxID=648782 RepID=A0A1H5M3I7_9MICO|nr:YafY family protein [Ruania alba]SEE83337.1 Predicted DNA-binding transcriptional regulator YafY, contains an HTH and WYL domains [Ruania alba]
MSTSSRTLRLLSLLQTHRYWSGDELADRLEVSIRTLRRDVDRLRDLGYPVQADRGVGGGYQLTPGAAMPPLVLDDEEAVALVVGLQSATTSSLAGVADASVRALATVVPVLPKRLRRRVEAIGAATVTLGPEGPIRDLTDPGTLVVLAQACRDAERVRFGYTSARGDSTHRSVEPVRLVTIGRRYYLLGFDLDRADWRSFRLDRLSDPEPTGHRFRPREVPGGDAAAYIRRGLRRSDQGPQVSAVLAADADRVREQIGRWCEVTELGPGRCRVRAESAHPEWMAFALAHTGAEISAVEPESLRAVMRTWASRFTQAVGPPSGRSG